MNVLLLESHIYLGFELFLFSFSLGRILYIPCETRDGEYAPGNISFCIERRHPIRPREDGSRNPQFYIEDVRNKQATRVETWPSRYEYCTVVKYRFIASCPNSYFHEEL